MKFGYAIKGVQSQSKSKSKSGSDSKSISKKTKIIPTPVRRRLSRKDPCTPPHSQKEEWGGPSGGRLSGVQTGSRTGATPIHRSGVGPTDGRFPFFFDNVSKNDGDKDFEENKNRLLHQK
jgi:hypothetical protein